MKEEVYCENGLLLPLNWFEFFFSSRSYLHCIRNENRRKRENESE